MHFQRSRNLLAIICFILLSSTSKTLIPANEKSLFPSAFTIVCSCCRSVVSKGSSNEKTLPVPTLLLTRRYPPWSSTSFRVIASPRPVPPYLRVVFASAWLKNSKIVSSFCSSMPIPVSVTENCIKVGVSSLARDTFTLISPFSVNFKALPIRFVSIWFSLIESPATTSGSSRPKSRERSIPLSAALKVNILINPLICSFRLNSIFSNWIPVASILLKSRISLTIDMSWLPENSRVFR